MRSLILLAAFLIVNTLGAPVFSPREPYIAILKSRFSNEPLSNNLQLGRVARSYESLLDDAYDARPFALDVHSVNTDADYKVAAHHFANAMLRLCVQRPAIPNAALHGFTFTATPQEAARIAAHEYVSYVERDQIMTINQNHPGYTFKQPNPPSWGLDRIDQRRQEDDQVYEYPQTAGASVTVYVIDTGIQVNSSEFTGSNGTRAFWGSNVLNDSDSANNTDDNGHGTFVSAIVGSNTYGVAKNVTLIAVKALNAEGSGTSSGLIRGLEFVLGAWNSSRNASIPVVVAAGNSAQDACQYSPAGAVAAVTCGGTDKADRISTFSNFGSCVDIFAPATNVTSLGLDGRPKTASGTSFASPYTTGSLALYWSVNTSLPMTDLLNSFGTRSTPNVVQGINFFSNTPNRFIYSLPPIVDRTDP
ncbi:hypothetical protein SmJEL517_g04960 [Synchytrium microbalum]|uniref:Peptidase S8/S53 domain-containing protein n=1 Tax=Synchytrium microbalum TaxID=1806994 RepID=A0A507BY58_9FUNG|nr:uncharacterized protein SmJEL517_g04960 [Synchytrium microbalum]TPX31799.1 hypothetical protein SmJEL517_g04960 [Synchytrium microbalum]